jgi:hypothetical protein
MDWACGTRGRGCRALAFLLLVREVPFLRIRPKTGHPDRGLSLTSVARQLLALRRVHSDSRPCHFITAPVAQLRRFLRQFLRNSPTINSIMYESLTPNFAQIVQ